MVNAAPPPAPDEPIRDIAYFDKDDPRSLVNLVSPKVAEAFKLVPPDLVNQAESALRKIVKPTEMASRLRVAFWIEYDRAQAELDSMNMARVYGAVCSRDTFYDYVLANRDMVAWIMSPPARYMTAMEECLLLGIDRLREILSVGFESGVGVEFNVKRAEVIIKVFALIDARVRGAVVQRLETKQLNVHVKAGNLPNDSDVEAIEERIRQLETKSKYEARKQQHEVEVGHTDETPEG